MRGNDSFIFKIAEGRWRLSILDALLDRPQRFTDLRRRLPALSANVLARKLRELELHGIVCRRTISAEIQVQIYELTSWGHQSRGVIRELRKWGSARPRLQ